jgi:hypothetical protein
MKTTQLCHNSYKDISQFHKYKWTLYINFTTKSQGIETHTTVLTTIKIQHTNCSQALHIHILFKQIQAID